MAGELFELKMAGLDDLTVELRAFPAFLTGVVSGKRRPLTMALQAAGGVIRDQASREAAMRDQKRWWTKDNPQFWQYRWYESGLGLKSVIAKLQAKGKRIPKSMLQIRGTNIKGHVYTQQKRPTKRLYKALRVKVSKLSTDDMAVVRVYVQYSRSWDKWDTKNAWYGRFVEFGTKAQWAKPRLKGKGVGHHGFHKATQPYPFFIPAVASSKDAAAEAFTRKLQELLANYKAGKG